MESLFAVCAPGLEAVTARELMGLGLLKAAGLLRGSGGVSFPGSLRELYLANLGLRSAERVLLRLAEFPARQLSELEAQARRLPWQRYLSPGSPASWRVSSKGSRLYHEKAIADRLHKVIPKGDGPLVFVDFEADRCTISIDACGEPLHKRGYRLAAAKAPLRETLASAMLLASGWDRRSPLLDPFCGSGTIAIEAALMAKAIDPGCKRHFAFMDWPGFDSGLWQKILSEAGRGISAECPVILASDRDEGAIRAAQANAQRAGVADCIQFSCRAVSAIEPPSGPGWVVSNPPYGVRVSQGRDLRDLYAQLGKTLKAKCQGWQAALLGTDLRLVRASGLPFIERLSTMNGGLQVKLASCTV